MGVLVLAPAIVNGFDSFTCLGGFEQMSLANSTFSLLGSRSRQLWLFFKHTHTHIHTHTHTHKALPSLLSQHLSMDFDISSHICGYDHISSPHQVVLCEGICITCAALLQLCNHQPVWVVSMSKWYGLGFLDANGILIDYLQNGTSFDWKVKAKYKSVSLSRC